MELVDFDLLILPSSSITDGLELSREGLEEEGDFGSACADGWDLAASWLSKLESLEPELPMPDIGLLASDERGRLE